MVDSTTMTQEQRRMWDQLVVLLHGGGAWTLGARHSTVSLPLPQHYDQRLAAEHGRCDGHPWISG